MDKRSSLQSVVLALLVAGCGGRTTPGWGVDGDVFSDLPRRLDTARRDARRGDLPIWRKDVYRPPDVRSPDACLPIPASQVAGGYAGSWTGTWYCTNTASTIQGNLKLSLQPAGSPSSFAVQGALSGSISSGYSIGGSVAGTMVCTTFSGTIPDLFVGWGSAGYKLQGALSGVYSAKPGVWSGFQNGSWKASDPSSSCYASGTWSATR
jgi:hypothetical protein